MNEMIYTYDGSFEGFLCCIFDSYANKEVLTAITDDEDSAYALRCPVYADSIHILIHMALWTWKSIHR